MLKNKPLKVAVTNGISSDHKYSRNFNVGAAQLDFLSGRIFHAAAAVI